MIQHWRHAIVALLLAATFHTASGVMGAASADQAAADLVIRGGFLIDMVSDQPHVRPIKGMLLRDGKILQILEARSRETLPAADRVINGESLYILPGLIDSHVHFRAWFPKPFLYFGVTTLMDTAPCPNCSQDPADDPNTWILRYKKALDAPDAEGPSLFVTGMKLDGPQGKREANVYLLQTLDQIAPRIKALADLGVDGIKVEESLPPAFRRRVVEEAAKRNLPVVGHSRETRESITAGMTFIEHMSPIARSLAPEGSPAAEHLMDLRKAPDLIELMKTNRVYLNPTMVARYGFLSKRATSFAQEDALLLKEPIFRDVPDDVRAEMTASFLRAGRMSAEERRLAEEGFWKAQEFIREFATRGGLLLSGTDSIGGRVPGISMQRELQLLVDAGVAPYTALLGATRLAGDLMRMSNRIGTLQPGKQADVLILGSNPVDDIAATKDIRYVIRRGAIARAPLN